MKCYFSEHKNWDRNLPAASNVSRPSGSAGQPETPFSWLTCVSIETLSAAELRSPRDQPKRSCSGNTTRNGAFLADFFKSLMKNCAGFFFRAKQRGEELHFTHEPCHVVAIGAEDTPSSWHTLLWAWSFHLLEWHRIVLEAIVKNLEEMVTEKHGALHDCRSNFCQQKYPSWLRAKL